jgi:hypothetical protein
VTSIHIFPFTTSPGPYHSFSVWTTMLQPESSIFLLSTSSNSFFLISLLSILFQEKGGGGLTSSEGFSILTSSGSPGVACSLSASSAFMKSFWGSDWALSLLLCSKATVLLT